MNVPEVLPYRLSRHHNCTCVIDRQTKGDFCSVGDASATLHRRSCCGKTIPHGEDRMARREKWHTTVVVVWPTATLERGRRSCSSCHFPPYSNTSRSALCNGQSLAGTPSWRRTSSFRQPLRQEDLVQASTSFGVGACRNRVAAGPTFLRWKWLWGDSTADPDVRVWSSPPLKTKRCSTISSEESALGSRILSNASCR